MKRVSASVLRLKRISSAYLAKFAPDGGRPKVIRLVVDTNVYISVILFGGTCEAVLALARAGIVELFLCPAIKRELRSVLGHAFGRAETQVREAFAEVNAITSIVRPSPTLSEVLTHDQDHRILECALTAKADFLVTEDKKHLQPLKTFHGVRIVSPRECLNSLC
ncbi:MAG: putative toxin-antitoxin system toxin component, PIN family [Candidatus Binatia bacterium]|nr:putative toxin-antitoxin system toxin component, PIN family [Candidatus Binatia bacterium]